MHRNLSWRLSVTVWLAVTAAPSGASLPPTADAPESVAFTSPRPGSIVVPVTVNGSGPYAFLLDTGSSHSSVDADLASRLGAPRVAKAAVSTATGEEWAAVVRLDGLSLGPVTVKGVLATEVAGRRLDAGGHILGVVGQDLLAERGFVLDYRRQRVAWPADLSARAEDVELPLDNAGGIWKVVLSDGRRIVRLVPDSGAEAAVLFDRRPWNGLRYQAGTVGVESVTNSRMGRVGVLPMLNLGLVGLVDLPVVVVDGADVEEGHGDGLLPLQLFDRVTFRPDLSILQVSGAALARASR